MSGKNIVLCSDGTGNTAIKARGTNVFKLYEAVDIQGQKYDQTLTPQVAFYDDGVGTSKLAPLKLIGGAFGYGFAKNVRDLYTELVHVYEPGDHIYLFGFSRGAYTVRTLSGLIAYCGILDLANDAGKKSLPQRIDDCWKDFRQEAFFKENRRPDHQPPSAPRNQDSEQRKRDRKRREGYGVIIDDRYVPDGVVGIKFVGVWDTVGAVGVPVDELRTLFNWFWPMRFSELTPSCAIERACHALSIDDDRRTFCPELWNEEKTSDTPATQQVKQVWFSGVHSNVGGGYVKHGMSLVALDWMMAEAEQSGLRFIEADRNYVRARQDVHDKLYDARAGLGVYYRWEPRNIAKLCTDHHMVPKIHVSVFERIANGTDGYAPVNLPHQFQVVGTRGAWTWPLDETLRKIQNQVMPTKKACTGQEKDESLLDSMSRAVKNGKWSYRVFATVSLYTFVAVLIYSADFGFGLPPFPQMTEWIAQWFSYPKLAIGGIYAFIAGLVWYWAYKVDAKMESVAQKQWQTHRKKLRGIFMNSRVVPPLKPVGANELEEESGEGNVDTESKNLKEREPIPA